MKSGRHSLDARRAEVAARIRALLPTLGELVDIGRELDAISKLMRRGFYEWLEAEFGNCDPPAMDSIFAMRIWDRWETFRDTDLGALRDLRLSWQTIEVLMESITPAIAEKISSAVKAGEIRATQPRLDTAVLRRVEEHRHPETWWWRREVSERRFERFDELNGYELQADRETLRWVDVPVQLVINGPGLISDEVVVVTAETFIPSDVQITLGEYLRDAIAQTGNERAKQLLLLLEYEDAQARRSR